MAGGIAIVVAIVSIPRHYPNPKLHPEPQLDVQQKQRSNVVAARRFIAHYAVIFFRQQFWSLRLRREGLRDGEERDTARGEKQKDKQTANPLSSLVPVVIQRQCYLRERVNLDADEFCPFLWNKFRRRTIVIKSGHQLIAKFRFERPAKA